MHAGASSTSVKCERQSRRCTIAPYVAPTWNSDNTKSIASSSRSPCQTIRSIAANTPSEAPPLASQKSARRDKSHGGDSAKSVTIKVLLQKKSRIRISEPKKKEFRIPKTNLNTIEPV